MVIFILTIGTIFIYNLNGYVLKDMKMQKFNEFKGVYYVFLLNPIATHVYMISSSKQGLISKWIPAYMESYLVEFSIFIQLAISIVLIGLSGLHLDSRTFTEIVPVFQNLKKHKKRKTL